VTDTAVMNGLDKSIDHCVKLIKTLDEDKKINDGITALTLPSTDWSFENSLLTNFDRSSGSNTAIRKIVSFIDDPLLHNQMKKSKVSSTHFSYPQDMTSGIKFLNDHAPGTKFNVVWLDFNRFPTFELFRQCHDIINNSLQPSAMFFVNFNINSTKIDILQVMENFKDAMHTHTSLSRKINDLENIMDEILLQETDEQFESLVTFISKIFSLLVNKQKSLVYTNYDEYKSFITVGFYIGSELSYARGLQSVSESLLFRHNIDIENENLLPRFLHNITTTNDKFWEYSAGRYYSNRIEWNKNFNECPINTWVFIKIKSKDGTVGKNKHIAMRSSSTKTFKTISGKNVKAACWHTFNDNMWSCKDYDKRSRVRRQMDSIRQNILNNEVSDSLADL